MAYTTEQLADLRAAIAEGVLQVRFSDGRQLIYRSLDEMKRIEKAMADEVEQTTTVPVRRTYLSFQRPT
jgi:hypothetical protein